MLVSLDTRLHSEGTTVVPFCKCWSLSPTRSPDNMPGRRSDKLHLQNAELLHNTSYVRVRSLRMISSAQSRSHQFLGHKFLYNNHCVLYGDISLRMSNLTSRFDDEGHHLNDMDLLWPGQSCGIEAILFGRTGTPPFMVNDLLVSIGKVLRVQSHFIVPLVHR